MRYFGLFFTVLGALASSSVAFAGITPLPGVGLGCKLTPWQPKQVSNLPGVWPAESKPDDRAYIYELQIAVNPKNPRNLAASGIYSRRAFLNASDDRPQQVIAFYSHDQGSTWHRSNLPEFPLVDGRRPREGDPTLTFASDGSLLYFARIGGVYHVVVSPDGGRTWQQPRKITALDHGMVATDRGSGIYKGNVYLFGLGGSRGADGMQKYELILIRKSSKDAEWRQSMIVSTAGLGLRGRTVQSANDLLVSSDGVVFMPFASGAIDRSADESSLRWLATSSDGGVNRSSLMSLTKIDGTPLVSREARGNHHSYGFAIDNSSGVFRDRLYTSWFDRTSDGDIKLLFSFSNDAGASWDTPQTIEVPLHQDNERLVHLTWWSGLPALAVDSEGLLILTWYRFLLNPSSGQGPANHEIRYERMMTASVDGGRSFLPAQPILPGTSPINGELADYLNVVSSPAGFFHALWMDGRSGSQQIWYAQIRLNCERRQPLGD